MNRTSLAPPPRGFPPPLNPAAAVAVPTSTKSIWPGVTESGPDTTAPRPPGVLLNPMPPVAPVATTDTWVTPAGTVNVCSAPVAGNVCVSASATGVISSASAPMARMAILVTSPT